MWVSLNSNKIAPNKRCWVLSLLCIELHIAITYKCNPYFYSNNLDKTHARIIGISIWTPGKSQTAIGFHTNGCSSTPSYSTKYYF